jgi:hypothetical protein
MDNVPRNTGTTVTLDSFLNIRLQAEGDIIMYLPFGSMGIRLKATRKVMSVETTSYQTQHYYLTKRL